MIVLLNVIVYVPAAVAVSIAAIAAFNSACVETVNEFDIFCTPTKG
jgi:hypothetical protein